MTPEPKEIGHQVKFPNTLVGLFKKGMWHIPEVMLSSGMALIGMALATIGCYRYTQMDGDNREYKSIYLVVRPDDPRAKKIKNATTTSYSCD